VGRSAGRFAVSGSGIERFAESLCEAIACDGDGPKAYLRGTHRLLSVERTAEQLQSLMPELGITRLADITGLDRIGVPVAMACRPNSRSVSVSQGKGLTVAAAAASALVEAAELYHAEDMLIPILYAPATRMTEDGRSIVFAELWRESNTPFDLNRSLAWAVAQDLRSGQAVWLPFDVVHADLSGEQPFGGGFGISSNGLAGGNSLTEAAIHGLCEVIERDSTARWQALDRSLRECTRLDTSSITDPDCIALLERLEDASFSVGLWNTTNLTGIASFHAAILDRRNPSGHSGAGDGCHLSPGIALLRALTEAIQTRLTYIAGTRDDLDPETYRLDLRRDRRNRHEALLADKPGFDFRQLVDHSNATLAADLTSILERLERAGLAAYGVDLSQPEIGLPVLRIVVPGLRLPSEAPR
jgi:YcaO-like protein with predicted kinase domain